MVWERYCNASPKPEFFSFSLFIYSFISQLIWVRLGWNFHRCFSIQKQVKWCTIDTFSLKFCTSQHSYPAFNILSSSEDWGWHPLTLSTFLFSMQICILRLISWSNDIDNRNHWDASHLSLSECSCILSHDMGKHTLYAKSLLSNLIMSVESQKGTVNIQRCSVENQKGAINIQRCSVENQKGAINIQRCSVENQKGAINIQRCSVENQKGAINIQRCSVENQKGAINIQRCSVENQKGAINIQRCSVENQKGAINIQRCSIENQKGTINVQSLW